MEPIVCATHWWGGGHIRHLDNLQKHGFNFINAGELGINRSIERWIRALHKRGMKFVMRWPDWSALGVCLEEHSFRAFDGEHNAHENGRIAGPSHWNEKANALAERSLQPYLDMGIDGVFINVIICDRPFPTDWYPDCRHVTAFWSFDPWAKRAWAKESDGFAMPPSAICGGAPPHYDLMRFYRWYQGGWFDKLRRLTRCALSAGVRNIWTWYVPLDYWDEENMADGTADSMLRMEAWRRDVKSLGGQPLVVNACMFACPQRWAIAAQQTMERANRYLGWESMISCGLSGSPDAISRNFPVFGQQAGDLGYIGVMGTDTWIRERSDEQPGKIIAAVKRHIVERRELGEDAPLVDKLVVVGE